MDTPSPRAPQRIAAVLLGAGVLAVAVFLVYNASARRSDLAARRAAYAIAAPGLNPEGARVVRLDVAGMTCAGCAKTVEVELRKVKGVAACRVDLASEVAEVRLESADTPTDALLAAVHDAGYEAQLEPDPPTAP